MNFGYENDVKNFLLFLSKVDFDKLFYDAKSGKTVRFKEVFPDGKYSIIGNSPVSLEMKNGDKIDESDHVIRFNNFKINNYESFIGSKSDIWITGGGQQAPNRLPDVQDVSSMKKVLLVNNSKSLQYKKNKILEKYGTLDSFYIFHNDLVLSNMIRLIQGIPTTGFVMLLLLGSRYKDINTYGFSFGSYKNRYHYYPDKVFQDYGHRWAKELQIFKLLIQKGLLKNNNTLNNNSLNNNSLNIKKSHKQISYKHKFHQNRVNQNTRYQRTRPTQTTQFIGQQNIFNHRKNKITEDTHSKLVELNKMLNI